MGTTGFFGNCIQDRVHSGSCQLHAKVPPPEEGEGNDRAFRGMQSVVSKQISIWERRARGSVVSDMRSFCNQDDMTTTDITTMNDQRRGRPTTPRPSINDQRRRPVTPRPSTTADDQRRTTADGQRQTTTTTTTTAGLCGKDFSCVAGNCAPFSKATAKSAVAESYYSPSCLNPADASMPTGVMTLWHPLLRALLFPVYIIALRSALPKLPKTLVGNSLPTTISTS